MRIPKGIVIDQPGEWVLRVKKNIYGQKQAGRVWNKYLVEKLTSPQVGFVQSKHDECVFYKGKAIYVLYTDDSILAGPDPQELQDIIKLIADSGLKITQEGTIEDFLGVNIESMGEGKFHLSQPKLIDQILKDLGLEQPNTTSRATPSSTSTVLGEFPDSKPFDRHFHYRSIIGKLAYLETTRMDISYPVHQCARFSENPKEEHGKAVKHIGRYLLKTRKMGTIFNPNDEQFTVYADADFSGNWKPDEAEGNSDTAKSRTGFVIVFMNCVISWKSKLQTEVALSTTEAEYIALSQALRKTIPIMQLVNEMKELGYPLMTVLPTVKCTLFEDNSGALTLARAPAMRPRTKHINIKYHHFRMHVASGAIDIQKIGTEDQPADMLTKPMDEATLVKHRKAMMGW
jgi:hypothetical protein